MVPTEKLCPKCGEVKRADQFYDSPKRPDGLSSYCRKCQVADAKARYLAHPRRRAPEGMKWCPKCETIKPLDDFGKNRSTHDGKQNYCRTCTVARVTASRQKDPTSHRNGARRYRERHPERVADMNARWGVGAPLGTYARLFEAQDGKCAICKTEKPTGGAKRFAIDHCHDTGLIRGLLCSKCNQGLGLFNHSEDLLLEAAIYLKNNHGLSPVDQPKVEVNALTDSILAK